jgi:hypothetical protein
MILDSLIGKTVLDLSPALLNPGVAFQRWHYLWLEEEFALEGVPEGGSPAVVLGSEQRSRGQLMLSIRYDSTDGLYSAAWEAHSFVAAEGAAMMCPGLCSICGLPILMPLAIGWLSCDRCHSDVHHECLKLVERCLPCKPRVIRATGADSTVMAQLSKLEEEAVGVLSLDVRSIHCCSAECSDVYHVFSSGNIVKSSAEAGSRLASPTNAIMQSSTGAGAEGGTGNTTGIFVQIDFESHNVTTPKIIRLGEGTDVAVNLSLSFFVKNPQSNLVLRVFQGDPATTLRKLIGECAFSIFDVVDQMTLLRFGGRPGE